MALPASTAVRVSPRTVIAASIWVAIVAGLLFSLTASSGPNQRVVVVLAGVGSVVFGIGVFIKHGGLRATVLGLFNVASAIFIGAAGTVAALVNDPRVPTLYLGYAVIAGLAAQIMMTVLTGRGARLPDHLPMLSPSNAAWAIRWGMATLLVLTLVERSGLRQVIPEILRGFLEGTAVAATVVLTVGILWRDRARLLSFGTVVVLTAFVMYSTVFHSGTGRLRIIALAGALMLLYTLRFQRRFLKWLVPAVVPIALWVLAQQRLSLQESIGVGGSAGKSGLESMLVPIVMFGQLLRAQAEGWPLMWGSSLLTFPVGLLPDSWFPEAPKAFGYEIAIITSPERYGTGYSGAATYAAEGFWNWSLPGLFIFVILGALLLRVIDRGIVRAATNIADDRRSVVGLSFWVTFGGAVGDLAWNGQHIFLTRTVSRLPLLILLWVLASSDDAFRKRRDRRERVATVERPRRVQSPASSVS